MTSPLFPQLPVVDLDGTRHEPLYEQLYVALRRQILDGRLRPGGRVASTRQMAEHLAVSRFTVVNALERLLAEGYLTTRAGAGTFVTHTLPERSMRSAGAGRPNAPTLGNAPAPLSVRGQRLSAIPITGPRPEEPRAFQSRRAPLDVFPTRTWAAIVRKVWQRGGYPLLEYGDPAGHHPLRRAIAAHIGVTRGVRCEPHQVIITCGSQQAFDVLFRLLLDPGDRAWIEEPGYLDVRAALLAAGGDLVPVPVDASGLNVTEGIRLGGEARLAVVSPSHQYPVGVTMSATRRLELLDWARARGAWIVEDDYDSYFRYSGRPMSALQSVDRASGASPRVIYVGTFSKTVFPSLRIGFCVVPDALVDAVVNARAIAGRHSPVADQAALTEFIETGQYDRHLRRMRLICRERHEALRHHVGRGLGDVLRLSSASAGTHVVARFARHADRRDPTLAIRVAALAATEGLIVFPLSRYCLTPPEEDALILGFGGVTPRRIINAVGKLAAIIGRARAQEAWRH